MNPYVLVFTEPFLALPICLSISIFLVVWYAMLAPEKWEQYSRFLHAYKRTDFQYFFILAGVISSIVTFISLLAHFEKVQPKEATIEEGIVLYGICFICLLYICSKASIAEKRDLVGLHKQQTNRLENLLTQHFVDWATHVDFEGKTKYEAQRIISKLKTVEVEVKQEKKIRKNKDNLYRSLERLERLENMRKELVATMEKLQKDIATLYDTLYQLEAVAYESRYENVKKQLDIAKAKLKKDPFEGAIYLKQLQKKV